MWHISICLDVTLIGVFPCSTPLRLIEFIVVIWCLNGWKHRPMNRIHLNLYMFLAFCLSVFCLSLCLCLCLCLPLSLSLSLSRKKPNVYGLCTLTNGSSRHRNVALCDISVCEHVESGCFNYTILSLQVYKIVSLWLYLTHVCEKED